MNAKSITKALEEARKKSVKRKFSQKIDLIVNLKGLDMKKPDNQIDFFAILPKMKGKQTKICGLVGPELTEESKNNLDMTITIDEFEAYQKDKKKVKKLAKEYDFFIAQANIMNKIATSFGRILGPQNKMPNPKAGCIVPPKANLKQLRTKLEKTVRISARKYPLIQLIIGNEDMADSEIVENGVSVIDQIAHHVPNGFQNIKSVYIKTTMGKISKVE